MADDNYMRQRGDRTAVKSSNPRYLTEKMKKARDGRLLLG
jgi:hypothetical protein